MNEQIKKLAAKAYLEVNPGPDPYNEAEAAWLGFGPLEQKFAELIVRECMELGDKALQDGKWPGDVLKEHFGVE